MTMSFRNWIGGEWVDGASSLPDINPSDTDDVIGHAAQADEAQALAAIAAGKLARYLVVAQAAHLF